MFAIASAIFLPVIKSWDMFIGNQGVDATSLLDNINFRLEFQKYLKDNTVFCSDNFKKYSPIYRRIWWRFNLNRVNVEYHMIYTDEY